MATKRVIIWDKEDARFSNDELGRIGEWAQWHMRQCPEMKHEGIGYHITTKESENGGYVGISKHAVCRACGIYFPLEVYFIDAETGKYVREPKEDF